MGILGTFHSGMVSKRLHPINVELYTREATPGYPKYPDTLKTRGTPWDYRTDGTRLGTEEPYIGMVIRCMRMILKGNTRLNPAGTTNYHAAPLN